MWGSPVGKFLGRPAARPRPASVNVPDGPDPSILATDRVRPFPGLR